MKVTNVVEDIKVFAKELMYRPFQTSKEFESRIEDAVHLFKAGGHPLIQSVPCMVVDVRELSLVFVSEAFFPFMGYDPCVIIQKGSSWFATHIHPRDYPFVSSGVNITSKILYTLPVSERSSLTTTHIYRLRNNITGVYHWVQQESTALLYDDFGNLVLSLERFTDISHLGRQNLIAGWAIYQILPNNKRMQLAGRTLERPRYDPFSPREADVARLLLLGRTSTEIGSQLDISPETVKALRKRLLKKTNCKNAAELASYLQDHNFG